MNGETVIRDVFAVLIVVALAALPVIGQSTPHGAIPLPVPADQSLAVLLPASEPCDLHAKAVPAGLQQLLGQPSRGAAATVFPRVAPAVVVVRTNGSYGTGFVIAEDGWILTNNHVIQTASIDANSGSRYAYIHFGDLQDGVMHLNPTSHPALVHSASAEKDLALLKLLEMPDGRELKPIRFSNKNAKPGSDCITIGHPKRGLFWAVRSGEVVGIGNYPHDMIDTVMPQFAMAVADRETFAESLRQNTPRKSLLSSCGINPGDSGGPLLNNQGELVAVNFAVPKSEKDTQVNLDKFSYHVHLDEVKAFTVDMPEKSEVFRPQYWPPATSSRIADRDDDGVFESWYFMIADDQPPSGVLVDLDGDTPASFIDDLNAGKTDRTQFDCEVVYVRLPNHRVFYDRNNDGEFDMVLTDINNNDVSDLTIVKGEHGWEKIEAAEQPFFDAAVFEDESLRDRFTQLFLTPVDKPDADTAAKADTAPDAEAATTPPDAAATEAELEVEQGNAGDGASDD